MCQKVFEIKLFKLLKRVLYIKLYSKSILDFCQGWMAVDVTQLSGAEFLALGVRGEVANVVRTKKVELFIF